MASPPSISLGSISVLDEARRLAAQFEYTDDDIRKCVPQFIDEMNEGLRQRTPAMCQIPTYLTKTAQGTEQGLALAVDLGGTNLRVCSVDLHGDRTFTVVPSKVAIPQDVMVAEKASTLFSFIAVQVQTFLQANHTDYLTGDSSGTGPGTETSLRQPLNLGFTFSFPAYQASINSGILLRWTKGFDIPEVVGKDVCNLLQTELDALKLPVRVSALVNDAAGAIMSRAYRLPISHKRTSIGAIFGTGTNCVYLEKLAHIHKPLEGEYDRETGEMFISIEWGSFNNHLSVLPSTRYDEELNAASLNPGNQMFEKRVSGLFLGELLREVLVEMSGDPAIRLFRGWDGIEGSAPPLPLHTRWAVDSSILSAAEGDMSEDLLHLRGKIEECLGVPEAVVSQEDVLAVKVISCAIGRRAARLAGMALGAVVLQSKVTPQSLVATSTAIPTIDTLKLDDGEETSKEATITILDVTPIAESTPTGDEEDQVVDIAVDGSVVEFYPNFESYMREALRSIPDLGPAGEKNIRIGIAKDGSSVGAAIIALLAESA